MNSWVQTYIQSILILSAVPCLIFSQEVIQQEECIPEPATEIIQEGSTAILDFDTAAQRVLEHSLHLKQSQSEINSRAADIKQAALFPNPSFSYQLDQFGGTNSWKGLSGCQSYYTITQPFELGGKRQLRKNVASYVYYASLVDYEASQLQVLNELQKAFLDVAANQEFLKLVQEEKKITQQALEATKEQIQSGKVTPIELTKAEIALCNVEIKEESIMTEWLASKDRLTALWGTDESDFDYVDYSFYEICPPSPLSDYLAELTTNPAFVKAHWYFSAAIENIKLQKSQRIPDVEVSAGYEMQEGPFANGLTVGVSFPLPLFDRNQGGIARASSEASEAKNEINRIWLELKSTLLVHHKKLTRAYSEIDKLNNRVLKSANQAYQLTEEGYREGKYDYLDVVDAQRAVFDVKAQYVSAILNYHLIKADLDYLISQSD